MVVDSGMGKAIRNIEKHKICKETANETAINTRVQAVKDAWNASVKANKVYYAPDYGMSSDSKMILTLILCATGSCPKEEASSIISRTIAGKEKEDLALFQSCPEGFQH
jgi:hypothetical protein